MSETVAEQLVNCLVDQGVDRVFCVPGESYIHVLDALRDSNVDTVVARQEGGAAMMAEADGKLTGRPGVCFVTRGPGATNASAGVHVAEQDSTPLVLFIGQVASTMLGRGAFQEVDYRQFYGGLAKRVLELRAGRDIGDIVRESFRTAESGRPGPVVVVLPEDLQGKPHRGRSEPEPGAPRRIDPGEPSLAAISTLARLLETAERPFAIVGGSGWNEAGVAALQTFAERWQIPVSVVFRRQRLFDHDHPNYAGDCGIGLNPNLRRRIEESDLVIVLGTRFSEVPSQQYTLLEGPVAGQSLVHVSTAPDNRFPHADLTIDCHPQRVLSRLDDAAKPIDASTAFDTRAARVTAARQDFESWSGQPPRIPGALQMGDVIRHLRGVLPDDAVICNGAGNYAVWVHRYFRFRGFASQLAPTSGSMGYGLPAAVAAKLRNPERPAICFAGDGCFQMTGQEFGTAVQYGANVVVLVVDNGMYGTIRMHQERRFPTRVHGTSLVNPDFAALARAYGAFGATVRTAEAFAPALAQALGSGSPAILHLCLDPEAITPDTTLSELADLS